MGAPAVRRDARFRAAIEAVLEPMGLFVLGETQVRAPVDTGRLRGSYTTERRGPTELSVGSNVEYAPYQEYGTVKMKAQPHLRPAVKENLEPLGKMLRDAVRKGLQP